MDSTRLMFLVYYLTLHLFSSVASETSKSPLNGQHLIMSSIPSLLFRFARDETGYILKVNGPIPEMLKGFAQLFNMTYSILQVNDTTFEPKREMPGLIQYVVQGKCDALINYAVTTSRVKLLDVSHPYLYMPVSFLIPMPKTTISISSILESFQSLVWIGFLIATISTILFFYLFNHYFAFKDKQKCALLNNSKLIYGPRTENLLIDPTLYVIGLILDQSRKCSTKKLSIRIVAAVWCLGTFVIISLYRATLISYITLNRPEQLIHSAEDLVHRPNVHLLVEDGLNVQAVLKSASAGLLKDLGDKLRNYPNSGCVDQECIRMLKSGSHVYSMPIDPYLYTITRNEYRATGKCDFQILLNKAYMDLQMVLGLPKRSPYINDFNRGTMIMREGGLIDQWLKIFRADAGHCVGKAKEITSFSSDTSFAPLTVKNLNGAFFILGVGYLATFLIFVCECITLKCCSKKKVTHNSHSKL